MNTSLHVLIQAIRERASGVVRVRSGESQRIMHVRFLADGRESGENGFWVELIQGDAARIDRLIAADSPVQVCFQSGQARLAFVTTIQRRQRAFLRGERLLMSYPTSLQIPERRRRNRQRIADRIELGAWLEVAGHERRLPVVVWDLSPTGAAFVLPAGSSQKLSPGQPLNVHLRFQGAEHRLTAYHRNTIPMSGGRVRIGVEFEPVGQETSPTTERLEPLLERLRGEEAQRTLAEVIGRKAIA